MIKSILVISIVVVLSLSGCGKKSSEMVDTFPRVEVVEMDSKHKQMRWVFSWYNILDDPFPAEGVGDFQKAEEAINNGILHELSSKIKLEKFEGMEQMQEQGGILAKQFLSQLPDAKKELENEINSEEDDTSMETVDKVLKVVEKYGFNDMTKPFNEESMIKYLVMKLQDGEKLQKFFDDVADAANS